LQEVIDLAKAKVLMGGLSVFIPKQSTGIAIPSDCRWKSRWLISSRLMDMTRKIHVFIQSFEVGNLKELNTRIDVPLVLDAQILPSMVS